MQGAETTAFTLNFFILQAATVFFAAWLFIFFIIRNKRRRTEPFRIFKEILKDCPTDPELDSLINDYTNQTLKYMETLVSPEKHKDAQKGLLLALENLNNYLISKKQKTFLEPSSSDQNKLYKSALLMKNVYHVKIK